MADRCERCNDTGVTVERLEGTDYPSPCRSCDRYDPAVIHRGDCYKIMERTEREVPVVHIE